MGRLPTLATWSGDLTRPVPLAAAATLAVNDHLLKGAGLLPATVTGKLSDVAGLLVAGIAAVCLARGLATAVTGRLPRRDGRVAVAALVAVAAGFGALKLWPAFNQALTGVWGVNVLDPTDLWALPMLAVGFLWLRDREAAAGDVVMPRRFVTAVALLGVLLVCAATPAPPPVPPPPRPGWVVDQAELVLSCGTATAWVSKSGKTGAGLTVLVTRAEAAPACELTIVGAAMRFPDATIAGREIALPPAADRPAEPDQRVERGDRSAVAPERLRYHYVAFELDNQARWNRGQRDATFELEVELAGERRRWTFTARHVVVEFPATRRYDR